MGRKIQTSKRPSGFTLVELLIVVAIIGVLSTIGVPTFKKMVQKSKKSEAKVNLGGLYTAEQAFFSEYGGFGSNLNGIGFSEDGNTFLYTVGFPGGSAAPVGGTSAGFVPGVAGVCDNTFSVNAAALPQTAGGAAIGTNIQTIFPSYYTNTSSIAGRAYAVPGAGAAANAGGICASGEVEANGAYFVATATGCVGPGCVQASNLAGLIPAGAAAGAAPPVCSTTAPCQDVWSINDGRILSNVGDGVY